jgi:dihydroorotate dehydrogenase
MGFNNPGAAVVAQNLAEWRRLGRWPKHPVGINLGKSKITPLENAAEDYAGSLRLLWPHADFFVVNVSSPNTPNLRHLQDKAALDAILAALQELNAQLSATRTQLSAADAAIHPPRSADDGRRTKPILVKIAPDLSFQALDEILELVGPRQLAGLVATNTTIARPETADPDLTRVYSQSGGLSGRPLRQRSTEIIRHLYRQTNGTVPIIGVGGILNAADGWEKITAGASLLQVYTGLIYEGPSLAREIVSGLRERLQIERMANLWEAIGREA